MKAFGPHRSDEAVSTRRSSPEPFDSAHAMYGHDEDVDRIESDGDAAVRESPMRLPARDPISLDGHTSEPSKEVDIDGVGERDEALVDPIGIGVSAWEATEQERHFHRRSIDDVKDAHASRGCHTPRSVGCRIRGHIGEVESQESREAIEYASDPAGGLRLCATHAACRDSFDARARGHLPPTLDVLPTPLRQAPPPGRAGQACRSLVLVRLDTLASTVVDIGLVRPAYWHAMRPSSNSQSSASGLERPSIVSAPRLVDLIGPWASGANPLNEQLANALVRVIQMGLVPPGTRLPAERELARELALSRTTIVAAYERLRFAGLARSRRGSGTQVVAGAPSASVAAAAMSSLHRLVDADLAHPLATLSAMSVAQPARRRDPALPPGEAAEWGDTISLTVGALPASSLVSDAIAMALQDDVPDVLNEAGYDPFGLPSLRAGVAKHMTAVGAPTHADQIVVTSGAQQAIHLIASTIGRPGMVVAMEDPTYIGAIDAFRTTTSRLVLMPIDADGPQVEMVGLSAGTNPVRLAYVVPTFHNPTGLTMPEERRRNLVHMAGERGFQVIEDLTPDTSLGRGVPPPLAAFDKAGDLVISIGSLSKVAWGGLRIGWVRASRPDIDRLVAAKIVADHSSSLITQAIAVRVLDRLEAIAAETTRVSTEHRQIVTDALAHHLPDWEWKAPGGGLTLWVRLPNTDAVSFSRLAADHGVIVRPGPLASPVGGYRDHIRIAYGASPDRLAEGVERLAKAWAAYSPSTRHIRLALAVSV